MSGASIKDGHYIANAAGGVPVGEYLVRISGFRVDGGASGPGDMLSGVESEDQRVQYLPAKYIQKSELRLKVDGDSDELVKNYELTD